MEYNNMRSGQNSGNYDSVEPNQIDSVFKIFRLIGGAMGVLIIVIAVYFSVGLFSEIYGMIKNPDKFNAYLNKWEKVIAGNRKPFHEEFSKIPIAVSENKKIESSMDKTPVENVVKNAADGDGDTNLKVEENESQKSEKSENDIRDSDNGKKNKKDDTRKSGENAEAVKKDKSDLKENKEKDDEIKVKESVQTIQIDSKALIVLMIERDGPRLFGIAVILVLLIILIRIAILMISAGGGLISATADDRKAIKRILDNFLMRISSKELTYTGRKKENSTQSSDQADQQ